MGKPTAVLHMNLYVTCPHCNEEQDLFDDDADHVYIDPVFENRWKDLKDEEVYCEYCDKEFELEGVEW